MADIKKTDTINVSTMCKEIKILFVYEWNKK